MTFMMYENWKETWSHTLLSCETWHNCWGSRLNNGFPGTGSFPRTAPLQVQRSNASPTHPCIGAEGEEWTSRRHSFVSIVVTWTAAHMVFVPTQPRKTVPFPQVLRALRYSTPYQPRFQSRGWYSSKKTAKNKNKKAIVSNIIPIPISLWTCSSHECHSQDHRKNERTNEQGPRGNKNPPQIESTFGSNQGLYPPKQTARTHTCTL